MLDGFRAVSVDLAGEVSAVVLLARGGEESVGADPDVESPLDSGVAAGDDSLVVFALSELAPGGVALGVDERVDAGPAESGGAGTELTSTGGAPEDSALLADGRVAAGDSPEPPADCARALEPSVSVMAATFHSRCGCTGLGAAVSTPAAAAGGVVGSGVSVK